MLNKTLLLVVKGNAFFGDAVYHLIVAEMGEVLASHVCSHEVYAKGDLYSNRPERVKEFTERFGEIEVKYLHETDLSEKELLERNAKWYETVQKKVSE
jgi:hypothetical protein